MRHVDLHADASILSIQAVRISNALHGNETVSSFELVKGFRRSDLKCHNISSVPHNVIESHININAKRKLNPILRSHIFTKRRSELRIWCRSTYKDDKAERGTWLSPRIILSMNQDAGFVVVPGHGRNHISVAFKDTRAEHDDCALSDLVQSAIVKLEKSVSEFLDMAAECATSPLRSPKANVESAESISDFSFEPPLRPDTGALAEMFWSNDNQHCAGAVTEIRDDGKCVIFYDDK